MRCLLFSVACSLCTTVVSHAVEIEVPFKKVLLNADTFELISLDPAVRGAAAKNEFHGYKELGRTAVKDRTKRRKLIDAIHRGMKENTSEIAKCFNPRHGIHVVHKGKTVDFVICFECLHFHVHENNGKAKTHTISRSPQKSLSAVLKAAKIPFPKN